MSVPSFDLQAAASEVLLNDLLRVQVNAGIIPTSFEVRGGFSELRVNASENHSVKLRIVNPKLLVETGNPRRIGLTADYEGEIFCHLSLAEWVIDTPQGQMRDPAIEESWSIPFSGRVQAFANVLIAESSGGRHLSVSFQELHHLSINQIGDLEPGAVFTEVVRRCIERIAVVKLRREILLPDIGGLAGSLPAPLNELLSVQHGQIGLVDLKVTDSTDENADGIHILFQASQNVGEQSYDLVHPINAARREIAVVLTSRWIDQIRNDFWQGGLIPRRFSDAGIPSANGSVLLENAQLVGQPNGTALVRVRLRRNVGPFPVVVSAELTFRPFFNHGVLQIQVIDVKVTPDTEWGGRGLYGVAFLLLFSVLAKAAVRGVNFILQDWVEAQVTEFIENQRIDLNFSFPWEEAKVTASVEPSDLTVSVEEWSFGLNISFQPL